RPSGRYPVGAAGAGPAGHSPAARPPLPGGRRAGPPSQDGPRPADLCGCPAGRSPPRPGRGADDSDPRRTGTLAMTRPRRLRTEAVQSPLETYLREINETPLLSADLEKQLAYRIEDGDAEARDQMVRANLRLVVNIARGYTGKGLGLQDLIEEGNLGLLRAVQGFDPSLNTRFSTYASYWIKQSIKRALINTAKTIRIPAYMVELIGKWKRATVKLHEELGRTPTPEEIARSME